MLKLSGVGWLASGRRHFRLARSTAGVLAWDFPDRSYARSRTRGGLEVGQGLGGAISHRARRLLGATYQILFHCCSRMSPRSSSFASSGSPSPRRSSARGIAAGSRLRPGRSRTQCCCVRSACRCTGLHSPLGSLFSRVVLGSAWPRPWQSRKWGRFIPCAQIPADMDDDSHRTPFDSWDDSRDSVLLRHRRAWFRYDGWLGAPKSNVAESSNA